MGSTGKNKAKTAVSVAVEAKPEVEYGSDPKNQKSVDDPIVTFPLS